MAICFNCGAELPVGGKAIVLQDGRLMVCALCEANAKRDIERLDAVPEGSYPEGFVVNSEVSLPEGVGVWMASLRKARKEAGSDVRLVPWRDSRKDSR
jgi:hypothetical protein